MINLLKIEWLKIKNYTAFKVMGIFFVIGIFVANLLVYKVQKGIVAGNEDNPLLSGFQPYGFENTWQTTSYVSGFLLLLPAMLLIMLVTNEYSFRTNRQNIIDGWSRHQFIITKIMMALIMAIISTILVFITAVIFGQITKTDFSITNIAPVGFLFLKALTYNLFAILISVLIKKSGFAMGIFFIYIAVENLASELLDNFSDKIKDANSINLGSMGNYLPMNAADGLIKFPKNPITAMINVGAPTDYIYVILAFAIAYILLFAWWSRRKYMTADL